MATLEPAAILLAESLPVEAVPAKLRCGSCNKLAVNAVKLPCCDQSICEPCSQDLPDTCPICGHSPLSSEDCKPNKNLRLTVRAFIKNEEKKRSKDVEVSAPAPELTASALVPSGTPAPSVVPEADGQPGAAADAVNGDVEPHGIPVGDPVDTGFTDLSMTGDASRPLPDGDQEGQADADAEMEDEEDDDDDVVITTERPEEEMEVRPQARAHHGDEEMHEQNNQDQGQKQMDEQPGFGFGQNQGFGNMDFSSMNNFNPMMAMQSGMGVPNFGMGMPNMMGIPGMNMDPSMMFGGGFGGMGGMNDMSAMLNMGMGAMSGFGGMPGMNGMNMEGGGGPNGFFPPNGGGYNQQNFGSHMNSNAFHHNNNRGYGGRPYNRGGNFGRGGRGFYGGRGRGGWQNHGQGQFQGQGQNYMNQNQNQNQNQQQYQQQHHQNLRGNHGSFDSSSAHQGATRGSPSYEPMNPQDGQTDDAGLQKRSPTADETNTVEIGDTNETENLADDEHANGEVETGAKPTDGTITEGGEGTELAVEDVTNDTPVVDDAAEPGAAIQSVVEPDLVVESTRDDRPVSQGGSYDQNSNDQQYQQDYGYGARGRGGSRGGRDGFRGRGGAYGYAATLSEEPAAPAPAPPINAPTGPKALRQGLPNSGWYSRPQQQVASVIAASPSEKSKSKPLDYESQVRSHSRSRSRSPERDRKERNRSSDRVEESDESYARRKERERRRRKDREGRYDDEGHGDVNGDKSSKKTRSRSESRNNERSKRRHRERDDEGHSSRSHRDRSRDRRKHRHRSRSPEKETAANGDGYESSRRKNKSDRPREDESDEPEKVKDRDRSRKHSRREDDREHESKDRSHHSSRHARSSKDEREPETIQSVVEQPKEEFEFKIKGKSATMKQGLDTSMGPPATFGRERRSSMQTSTPATPTTPTVDIYAADREKAIKDREEIQRKRMEGRRQSGQGLGKHSRDDSEDFEAPTGPRGDGDRSRGGKTIRKDQRKHSLKFEGEIGNGFDERDTTRWR